MKKDIRIEEKATQIANYYSLQKDGDKWDCCYNAALAGAEYQKSLTDWKPRNEHEGECGWLLARTRRGLIFLGENAQGVDDLTCIDWLYGHSPSWA